MERPTVAARPVARRTWRPRYSPAGVMGALLLGCASFTPSLLPREWLLQGVVAGLSASFGYGLGVLLVWPARAVSDRRLTATARRRLWVLMACVGGPLLAGALWQGARWQREIHRLMGMEPPISYGWLPILLTATAVLLTAITIARLLRWSVRRLAGWLLPLVPAGLAVPLAILIAVLLLVGVPNSLLWGGLVGVAGSTFATVNETTSAGTSPPLVPERSGSPASFVSWGSLGRQGRDFVSHAPSTAELTAFSGASARRPVRAYAGLDSATDTASRAAMAVRDLRRAGGFDRAVLLVATSTGSGWVDPAAVDTLEYMHNGDTATVSIQYSYFPSWLSFLVDHERARKAGRELFDRVHDAWSSLPPDRRPTLLVTGTSLGAFGAEGAFGTVADIRNRTDGTVLAGPPHFSGIHRTLVRERDAGTPERMPVYDSGTSVRFASEPGDLWRPEAEWRRPRVVYLRHGSDPVVFWTPRLVFARPDWLSEPRAPDVSPDMRWIPAVTFWQVTADLPFALDVPPGHGHNYRRIFVDAWAAVAPPEDWTSHDTRRLRARIETTPRGVWSR